jgi:hypothetical protein
MKRFLDATTVKHALNVIPGASLFGQKQMNYESHEPLPKSSGWGKLVSSALGLARKKD